MNQITVRLNFSQTVQAELEKTGKSKRWLYLQLGMTPQTFEARLENNDWRLGEIILITKILGL